MYHVLLFYLLFGRINLSFDDEMFQALPAGSVLPYKRAASEKSGLPVYQPGVQQQHQQQLQQQQQQAASAYHQILQMQQQPSIVPASCKLLLLLNRNGTTL